MISRRAALLGGAATIGGAAMLRKDHSGPRGAYFLVLQDALRAAGVVTPAMVIDRDRLDANIATLMADLPEGMGYRIVAKSLPSVPLLDHIRRATGTDRLMTFNLPMLRDLTRAMPDADQLLGKPLSVDAAAAYLDDPDARPEQIQWLIDTPERLRDYATLAESRGITLRIALELDVGLHRGGLAPGAPLAAALSALQASPQLRLSGLMGYEPHLASVPNILGWPTRARDAAWNLYQQAKTQVIDTLGPDALTGATLNAAGSPTYKLYTDTSIANEIATGSALVKPTDFDIDLLAAHQPASFIATPLIKGPTESPLPVIERLDPLRQLIDPNQARTLFIHGGHWLAEPHDPPGLRYNDTFGRSSNQEILTAGRNIDIAPGDFVFLRPTQSEAVFLQFGPILVYSNGEIVDQWDTFGISA